MEPVASIVPFLLIFIGLFFSTGIAYAAEKKARPGGCAGVFAGIVVFALFVISRGSIDEEAASFPPSELNLHFGYLILSVGLGFGFTLAYRALLEYTVIGCLTMLLTAGAGISFYCLLAVEGSAEIIVPGTYGFILGYFLNVIILGGDS